MATGWQELLEQMRAASNDVHGKEWDGLWKSFAFLMVRSTAFGDGHAMVAYVEHDPTKYALALLLTALLAPTEWPVEWEAQRPELVRALAELRRQTRSSEPTANAGREPPSFFALVELGPDKATVEIGHRVLATAVDLLGTPCRRDQVPTVADLCNLATSRLGAAYQRALARQGELAMREPLLAAHLRYRVAALRYDDAALAMNDAIGSVLFHPFDAAAPQLALPES